MAISDRSEISLIVRCPSREVELLNIIAGREFRTPATQVRVWLREHLAKEFGADALPPVGPASPLTGLAAPRSKNVGPCRVVVQDIRPGKEPVTCGLPVWSRGVCHNHWVRIQRYRKGGYLTDEWLVAHGRLLPVPGRVYDPNYTDTLETLPKPPPRGFPRPDTRWIFGWPDSMSLRHELEVAAGVPSSFPKPKETEA